MRLLYVFLLLGVFSSCVDADKTLSAQQIVDKAIAHAGGEAYERAEISFKFRDIYYKSRRHNGAFLLQRMLPDSLQTIDIVNNNGFTRLQNETKVTLADTTAAKYAESVNSVHYFVQLPYGLNDAAVHKKLLNETTLRGKEYYKIEVTFSEEGGGSDYEDVFVYWISKEDFTVDYLAYQYFTNGGGLRFREAFNPRRIEGIRFVDYKNYRPADPDVSLYDLDTLYNSGKLTELSTIAIENIHVRLLE